MSHSKLIILAFEKAKTELERSGEKAPSKNTMATQISIAIQEIAHFSFGEKSLTNYYRKATENGDLKISQREVVHALVHYLGFSGYQEFKASLEENKLPETEKQKKTTRSIPAFFNEYKSRVFTGFVIVILLVITALYTAKEEPRWMVWKKDHYEQTVFSADLLNSGKLKLYNEQRVEHFKKVTADCELQYFNPDGSVNYWYGKNAAGELEIFSSLGRHPQTGKTLKAITEYMIKKYICK